MAVDEKRLINVRPGLKRNNLPTKASVLAILAVNNRTLFISFKFNLIAGILSSLVVAT